MSSHIREMGKGGMFRERKEVNTDEGGRVIKHKYECLKKMPHGKKEKIATLSVILCINTDK